MKWYTILEDKTFEVNELGTEIRYKDNPEKICNQFISSSWSAGPTKHRRKFINLHNNLYTVARLVYHAAHPDEDIKGMTVHHIDGNTLNDELTNLQLLTCTEHMQLHGHARTACTRRYGDRKHVIDIYTGKEYTSITDTARATGRSFSTIARHCHKNVKIQQFKFK